MPSAKWQPLYPGRWVNNMLTLLGLRPTYSRWIKETSCLLMPWLFVLQGYQQSWYWLLQMRMTLPSLTLQWRHNERDGVSNHQPYECLLDHLFRRRSKKISKLRVTCLCAGNAPVTAEFPAQMASNAENVSIWWRHHISTDSIRTCVTERRNNIYLMTCKCKFKMLTINES